MRSSKDIAARRRADLAAWNRERSLKPFSVWPPDREQPFRLETFERAERYARAAIKRTGGYSRITIEHDDGPVATLFIDHRDKVVTDLTDIGTRFA